MHRNCRKNLRFTITALYKDQDPPLLKNQILVLDWFRMPDTLFVALISRDTKPLYMQMFDCKKYNDVDFDRKKKIEVGLDALDESSQSGPGNEVGDVRGGEREGEAGKSVQFGETEGTGETGESSEAAKIADAGENEEPHLLEDSIHEPTESIPDTQKQKQMNLNDAGIFLKYNFLAHMALDVFAAPIALASRESLPDGVVLLFIQDEVVVYGMETNHGLKIVVGMSGEMQNPLLLALFNRIHRCYIRTVCNPFSEVLGVQDCENMLQTERFDTKIREAIKG